MRSNHRVVDECCPVKITPGYIEYPEGSVLIKMGKTRVLCAGSVENQVPKWLVGQNQGWLTAEFDQAQSAHAARGMCSMMRKLAAARPVPRSACRPLCRAG